MGDQRGMFSWTPKFPLEKRRETDVWFICNCSLCSIYLPIPEMKELLFLLCINKNQIMGNRNSPRSRFYTKTSSNLTARVKETEKHRHEYMPLIQIKCRLKFLLATSPKFSRPIQCHPIRKNF